MSITAVTGLPGHGKTLYAIWRWMQEAAKGGRPVWHNNIKGLSVPGWQPIDVKDWETAPAGSIIVVDEAQFAFPVTGRGQTPEWVQKLATHRHLGLDFVVITQDPMLLDSFVRRLVDRHFHVVRTFGMQRATIYEFPNGVREDVRKNRREGIRHEWRYPKQVFELYQSAELHTVKRRLPARLYLLAVVPFVFGGLCWFAYHRMKPSNNAAAQYAQEHGQAQATAPGAQPAGGQQGIQSGQASHAMTAIEYAQSYAPRVAGLPHTAPAYDTVTQPTEAPYPAACVSMPAKHRCSCYTQQGTLLDTGKDLCEQIARGGFFVAWRQQVVQAVPTAAPAVAAVPAPAPVGVFDMAQPGQRIADSSAAALEQDPARPRVRR